MGANPGLLGALGALGVLGSQVVPAGEGHPPPQPSTQPGTPGLSCCFGPPRLESAKKRENQPKNQLGGIGPIFIWGEQF